MSLGKLLLQDYKQQRPSQELVAKDLHGLEWRFRHIYRGTPQLPDIILVLHLLRNLRWSNNKVLTGTLMNLFAPFWFEQGSREGICSPLGGVVS